MPSDADLIIQIPEDEEVKDVEVEIVSDEKTTSDENKEESSEEKKTHSPAETWPAIKLYQPLIGMQGTKSEIPEDHEYALAANLMLAPVGANLREGQSNIFITGATPEDVAQELYNTIVTVFTQMREQASTVKPATMEDLPPVIKV